MPNIWIACVPEASRPVISLAHSCDRCAAASARVEVAVAQGERAGVVLRDVEQERLAQPPRDDEELGERVAGSVVVAEDDVRRDEPRERLALDLDVVQLLAELERLEQHPR